MSQSSKKSSPTQSLHPRNPHKGRYEFGKLTKSFPELKTFLINNPAGDQTINFSDPKAVLCLNKALLAHFYQVKHWQIPKGYLCPPIPGRADYIHNLADLLARTRNGKTPTGDQVKGLDIGSGANCIYPIIGSQSYGWQFVGSDIDPVAVKTSGIMVQSNTNLKPHIELRLQKDGQAIFRGIITPTDRFDFTLCNPPFHSSFAEATEGNQRKTKNLSNNKKEARNTPIQGGANFGGQTSELYCEGGEIAFLKRMAGESKQFGKQVCWFSSLVSKNDNVRLLKRQLKKLGAVDIQVMEMKQGNKISRIIAWSYLDQAARKAWAEKHWVK